jgi:hypothetical protein
MACCGNASLSILLLYKSTKVERPANCDVSWWVIEELCFFLGVCLCVCVWEREREREREFWRSGWEIRLLGLKKKDSSSKMSIYLKLRERLRCSVGEKQQTEEKESLLKEEQHGQDDASSAVLYLWRRCCSSPGMVVLTINYQVVWAVTVVVAFFPSTRKVF